MSEVGAFQLIKQGNLRVEIHFAEALIATINVIMYAEFENVIEIDRNRQVVFDYSAYMNTFRDRSRTENTPKHQKRFQRSVRQKQTTQKIKRTFGLDREYGPGRSTGNTLDSLMHRC